jgi:hypothetical protein
MTEKTATPDELGAAPFSPVSCPLCDGGGQITNPEHPDHPKNTHDGHDETWCLGCDGSGLLEVKRGVVMQGRYEGERLSRLKRWRAQDGPPNDKHSEPAEGTRNQHEK